MVPRAPIAALGAMDDRTEHDREARAMDTTELAQELGLAAHAAGVGTAIDADTFYQEASFILTTPSGQQFYVKVSPHEPSPVCATCGDLVHEGSNGVWYGSDSDPECYGEGSTGAHVPTTPVPDDEIRQAGGAGNV